jgi:hypothetical protein
MPLEFLHIVLVYLLGFTALTNIAPGIFQFTLGATVMLTQTMLSWQHIYSTIQFWIKISISLFYSSCSSFRSHLHSASSTLLPLFNPLPPRPPYQRHRHRHSRHYFLRRRVLQRPQAKPPSLLQRSKIDQHSTTFQATKTPTRKQSNIILSYINDLVHQIKTFGNNVPRTHSSHQEQQPERRSKYKKELRSQSVNESKEPRSQSVNEDPRGKIFSQSITSQTILNQLDFVQLHRLSTLFCPLPTSHRQLITSINEQLQSLGHILYNSDTYHPNISPSSVFISQHNESTIPIVIDSGASKGLSPIRSDFIQFKPIQSKLTGIAAQCEIRGIGIVRWKIIDQHGKVATIETEAYYVPGTHIRLYSPQDHFKKHKSGTMNITWKETAITLPTTTQRLSFPYDPFNRLPLMILAPGDSQPAEALIMEEDLEHAEPFYTQEADKSTSNSILISPDCSPSQINCAITDEQNVNLSPSQLELLGWHYKFGHISMQTIQRMMHPSKVMDNKSTTIELKHPKVILTKQNKTHSCAHPKCASCILGKMERLPTSTTSTPGSKDKHSLKGNDLVPGAKISLDQYVLTVKGRSITNSSKDSLKYNGGTIFVDHASGKIFNHHQISLRTGETLIGKRILERDAQDLGFSIKGFLADNGVFKSTEFQEDLKRKQQSIQFSGVGAHHQNGIAERAIKTISYLTRTNLIHSAIRWPGMNDLELWPMAFDHSVYIYNNTPSPDGLSPIEKWTATKFLNYDHLRRLHPWGCPAYVLDPKLQDGKKLPKWSPRSRQGKFVGLSKDHASNVALVLNPTTKRISPQFHILFDDFYSTVRSVDDDKAPQLTAVDWDNFLEMKGTDVFYDESDSDLVPRVDNEWLEPEEIARRNINQPRRQREQTEIIDLTTDVIDLTKEDTVDETVPSTIEPKEEDIRSTLEIPVPTVEATPPVNTDAVDITPPANPLPDDSSRHRSTRRTRKLNKKYFNEDFVNLATDSLDQVDLSAIPSFFTTSKAEGALKKKHTGYDRNQEFLQTLDWDTSIAALAASSNSFQSQQFFTAMESQEDPVTGTIDELHPLAFATKAADEDNPNWFEATNGENSEGFWEAMWKEVVTLQKIGAWEQVPRSQAPKVILSTWAFKIKRFPSGLVRKLKGRFCVRGDMQKEGIDVFETFAPVVSWTTIRLLLILSVILKLETTQVDYTSAFCQAPMEHDVFVALPKGWQHLNKMGLPQEFLADHVLKLKRSLYGQKDAPRIFFKFLKQNLLKCGYKQSEFDPCLFISKDVICLVYVDDCLFFSRNQSSIDKSIQAIRDVGMELNVEDDVAGFLGVHIDHKEDGTVHLTQTGLIDRVISALDLEDANPKRTPAPRDPLGRDLKGTPFSQDFNYASVVGMMMYLCNNSRPDIAFAVNQCARYTHFPTEKHGAYLKHVGKYLKGTRSRGLILNPQRNDPLKIDCYADADFAGLWNAEDEQDPHCVRSRTGFIVMIANCPVIWKSKLQTEIALSTMESEYIALSTSCRDLLPLQNLVTEVANACGATEGDTLTIQSTIFEDNEPCKKLATMELPRMTNRSKHIAVKYHWFRARVGIDWKVESISSKDQLADIFTKSLPLPDFERLRFTIMGW